MPQLSKFSANQIDLTKLRQTLVTAFDEAELQELCFDLSIDYENLPPGGKRLKARELISHCQRQRRLLALVEVVLQTRPQIELHTLILDSSGQAPFKGLQHFGETDANLFFGRDRQIEKLAEHLKNNAFLAVVGASGSGKSSLVRAGLVPALRENRFLDLPFASTQWLIHTITPTATPLKELATTLTRENESVTATATLIDDLKTDSRSLDLYVNRILDGNNYLLLLIDQFEELFTLCKDVAERQVFIDNLINAITSHGRIILIITLRADFYPQCLQYKNLHALLETQQIIVPQMEREELRQAIVAPAQRAGLQFESGLVDLFLRDVGDEPGALPLLSHALLETWRRRNGNLLTLAGYTAAGGVHGAIAKTADSVYENKKRTEEQKGIIRNIFLRLTELGEGIQDTRRRVALTELVPVVDEEAQAVEAVIQLLTDARLLTTSKGTVEVAHEALIREWPTLRQWLDDNREGLRLHRQLTEAARTWDKLQRDIGALYRGTQLEQATEWVSESREQLNELEGEFLTESEAAIMLEKQLEEESHQRELKQARALAKEKVRREQVTRWGLGIVMVLLMLAVGAAIYGFFQAAQAERQSRISLAQSVASLSAVVQNDPVNDKELATLLAIEASRLNIDEASNVPWQVNETLRQTLAHPYFNNTLRGTEEEYGGQFFPLMDKP